MSGRRKITIRGSKSENGGIGKKSRLKSRGDARIESARKGYEDARLGLPLDYAYIDRQSNKAFQVVYENFRLRVIDMKARGFDIPPWKTKKSYPKECENLIVSFGKLNSGDYSIYGVPFSIPLGEKFWLPPEGEEDSRAFSGLTTTP